MKIKIFYAEEYNPGEFEQAINKFMENKNVINVQYSSTPGSPSGLREVKDHAEVMVVYDEPSKTLSNLSREVNAELKFMGV